MIQQEKCDTEKKREEVNQAIGPLIAALLSPKSVQDGIRNLVESIIIPNGSKLLTVMDLGRLPVSHVNVQHQLDKNGVSDPEQRARLFYVKQKRENWYFPPVKIDAQGNLIASGAAEPESDTSINQRKAELVILRPKSATALDDQITNYAAARLGVTVQQTTSVYYWRKKYARAYLLLSPKDGFEASSSRTYTADPSVFGSGTVAPYQEEANRTIEKKKQNQAKERNDEAMATTPKGGAS